MSRRASFLALLVGALCLAQTSLPTESPSVERVASKLLCSCGCHLSMDCKMEPWPCHMCRPAKEKIVKMQQAGMDDASIIKEFVKEQGPGVLLIEPGFWGSASDYLGLAAGLLLLIWFVRRNLKKRVSAAPEVDVALLERYHDQIEKDTAKLDQ